MTALTLTPDLDAGTVLLELTGTPDGPAVITRTDVNGSNPVRLRTGQAPIVAARILRRNYFPNPQVTSVTGFGLLGTGTAVALETTTVYSGSSAGKMTAGSTGPAAPYGWAVYTPQPAVNLPVGTPVQWRIRLRSPAAITVGVYGVANASTRVSQQVALAANTWTEVVLDWTATLTVTSMYFIIGTQVPSAVVYFDALLIGDPGPYFDGGTADAPPTTYDWTGGANNSGSTMTDTSGSLTVTDYEPALTGGIRYDVVDAANATTVATTTLERPGGHLERFASVQIPAQSHTAVLITGYDADREASTTVHEIIGREDPVPVVGPTRLRRGSLEVFSATYADALDAAAAAASPLLMFRQSDYPGMDMWFTPTRIRTRPAETPNAVGWRWLTSIEYVEVRSPRVPLLGDAGWTIDDLVSTYPTVAAVRSAFPTVADLIVGP